MVGRLVGRLARSRGTWCAVKVLVCAGLLGPVRAPVAAAYPAQPVWIEVVFENATVTAGVAKHVYILLIKGSLPNPLTYKAEAVGAGKRNVLGIPAGMLARPPYRVAYQQQSGRAKDAYDLRLALNKPFYYYKHSFTLTADRVNRDHILYQVLGDNSNRYAYSALVWAGLHPGNPPLYVWTPGWGQPFSCQSLHECSALPGG